MKNIITTVTILLFLASCAFAQEKRDVIYQTSGPVAIGIGAVGTVGLSGKAVQGAPYSATVTNESTQTLADGNHIIQKSSGTTARDSQGRTRQDAALPAIGNLSAANAPELVFIQDPVAQVSYTLNVTEKTAQKMTALFPPPGAPAGTGTVAVSAAGTPPTDTFFAELGTEGSTAEPVPPPPMTFHKRVVINDPGEAKTEDLGSQMMEGVLANGVRTTRTIPAGQIGNEKPLNIVTEVWTSPELKTVVYSKRTDPRMGEQIFRLTNIVRSEPDPSLFTVPANFKILDGPKPIIYRSAQ